MKQVKFAELFHMRNVNYESECINFSYHLDLEYARVKSISNKNNSTETNKVRDSKIPCPLKVFTQSILSLK